MKKLLLFTNIITLTALLGVWYAGCTTPPPPAALCTTLCYPANNARPFRGVTGKLAKALVENYKNNQWSVYGQARAGFEDGRAVWFNLDSLKRFVHEIESTACTACSDSANRLSLGVRVYFGTYPTAAGTTWTDYGLDGLVNPNNAEHHTLIMVPTYYDAKQHLDIDFDPLHMGENGCKPLAMKDVFDSAAAAIGGFLMPGNGGNAGMANHDESWPPPSPHPHFDPTAGGMVMTCRGATFAGVADGINCQ